jgi:hypothetical protein
MCEKVPVHGFWECSLVEPLKKNYMKVPQNTKNRITVIHQFNFAVFTQKI